MSQKKSNDHAKKPWESTFEEEKDEQGNLSRTARRQNTKKNTALTTSLLVVFIIIIIGVVGLYFLSQKTAKQHTTHSDKIEVVS